MNRFLFVLAVLGFSGLLSYFSLFRVPEEPALRTASVGTDLSEGVRYVAFATGSIDGLEKSFSGKSVPKEGYLRLSPISGVSYSSGDVPRFSGKSVTIGKGLYFFRLGDVFEDVSVEHPDFRLGTLSRGNFYLDTRDPASIRMFSVSALLTAELLTDKKTVTTAYVFPSTYFGYVPKFNTELKDADILRVSTINTIRYVDLKDPAGDDPVLGDDPAALSFFRKNLAFEKAQAAEFGKAYANVFRLSENVSSSELSEDFGWYFVNKEKKSAILKGKLLRNLRNLAVAERCEGSKCESSDREISSITETLSSMGEIDPALRDYGLAAIRRAYYLSYYENLARADAYFQSKTSNAFVTAVVRTTPGIKVEYGDYALLSEMHAARYYGDKNSAHLDEYLNSYVRSLLSGKAIRKAEFLPFSFFLKEYLSREGFAVSRTTLEIAYSLVSVSNDYYETLASDDQRFSTLTVLYYTYSKICDRIRKATALAFFEQREEGAYLKEEYVDEGGNPDLPAGFVESFDTLVKAFDSTYSQKQQELYASFLARPSGKKVSDTATVLEKSLQGLRDQRAIFLDYGTYKQRLALNESNREASGLILAKEMPTEEDIRTYFSKFNGMDASSLKVNNDYRKDGYYEVSVTVNGRDFSFRATPDEDYLIENLTFVNGGEKVDKFVHTSVSLEEKRELYEKQLSALTPDDPRYPFYVFENYFINAYLSDRTSADLASLGSDSSATEVSPEKTMDATTLVFVEQNLIRKDFRNIVNGFPISIANIDAKIVNGGRDINLSGIRKAVSGGGSSYMLEFSGKYLFDQHSFYRMSFKSLDPTTFTPQLGGVAIQILPRSIGLADIEKQVGSLYDYMVRIYSVTGSKTPSSIAINLTLRKLIVDGVEYDVPKAP